MKGLVSQPGADGQHLFVYGTLRRGCLQQHRLRDVEFLGPGVMRGRLYRVSWYPALVLDGSGAVRGEVYRLRNPERILPALDEFEGAEEFARVPGVAEMDGGRSVDCWVYVYRGSVEEHRRIRSGDFLLG